MNDGKNFASVALGFSSGSSECNSPMVPSYNPFQTLMLFYFSLEAVANKLSL
jgi:hypothetical protein